MWCVGLYFHMWRIFTVFNEGKQVWQRLTDQGFKNRGNDMILSKLSSCPSNEVLNITWWVQRSIYVLV